MTFAIDNRETIDFRGNKYFLRIRTCNTDNPIVLFLHGGCGSPDRAQVMKYQTPISKILRLLHLTSAERDMHMTVKKRKLLI